MASQKCVVVGIDEAGRGPLAGPVAVAALAFLTPAARMLMKASLTKDSKQLSEKAREAWYEKLVEAKRAGAIAYAVSFVSAVRIDRVGIVRAIAAAMASSLRRLPVSPLQAQVLLDGALSAPACYKYQKTIIRGDETIPAIALASIVAKVSRDRLMYRYAKKYPLYGFDEHKGYGTAKHYAALKKYGLSPLHRKSFLKSFR